MNTAWCCTELCSDTPGSDSGTPTSNAKLLAVVGGLEAGTAVAADASVIARRVVVNVVLVRLLPGILANVQRPELRVDLLFLLLARRRRVLAELQRLNVLHLFLRELVDLLARFGLHAASDGAIVVQEAAMEDAEERLIGTGPNVVGLDNQAR